MSDHKTRLKVAAIAVESVAGTFEDGSPATDSVRTPANCALKVIAPQTAFNAGSDVFERDVAGKTFSREPSIVSRKVGTITAQAEVRGAGGTITTVVSYDLWLKSCGMTRAAAEVFTVDITGSPAGGNFDQAYAGMTLTSDDSPTQATAKLIYINPNLLEEGSPQTESGADDCLIYDQSSPASAGAATWTGTGKDGSTTVTIAAEAAPVPYGNVYYFQSTGLSHYSCALYNPYNNSVPEDSTRQSLEGCSGNLSFSAGNIGEPMFMNYTLTGKVNDQDDVPLPQSIPFETVVPPPFNGVNLEIMNTDVVMTSPDDSQSPPANVCINTMNLDFNNDIQNDECATVSGGVKKVDINGRSPTASFNPRLLEEAIHNFFDDWNLQRDAVMRMKMGSAVGNRVEMIMTRTRYTTYETTDLNGNVVTPLAMGLYTPQGDPGDNEFYYITR
jgi:hypothetical protein